MSVIRVDPSLNNVLSNSDFAGLSNEKTVFTYTMVMNGELAKTRRYYIFSANSIYYADIKRTVYGLITSCDWRKIAISKSVMLIGHGGL